MRESSWPSWQGNRVLLMYWHSDTPCSMVEEQHTEIVLRTAVQDGNMHSGKAGVLLDATFTMGLWLLRKHSCVGCCAVGVPSRVLGRLLWEHLDKELLYSVLVMTAEGRRNNGSTTLSEIPMQEHWIGNVFSS